MYVDGLINIDVTYSITLRTFNKLIVFARAVYVRYSEKTSGMTLIKGACFLEVQKYAWIICFLRRAR